MNSEDRITVDTHVLVGKPIIKGESDSSYMRGEKATRFYSFLYKLS
jgi:hypothetical protein